MKANAIMGIGVPALLLVASCSGPKPAVVESRRGATPSTEKDEAIASAKGRVAPPVSDAESDSTAPLRATASFSERKYPRGALAELKFALTNTSTEPIAILGGGTFGDMCQVTAKHISSQTSRSFFIPRKGSAATERIALEPGEAYEQTFAFDAGNITITPDLSAHQYGAYEVVVAYVEGDKALAVSSPTTVEVE